jgi:hypothetical protein
LRVCSRGNAIIYLKRVMTGRRSHFILRESYAEGGWLKHRDVMDLGPDPSLYIEYPGGNGFYFDPVIEQTLEAKSAGFCSEDLEQVFAPFLKPHIRMILDGAQHTRRRPAPPPQSVVEALAPAHGRVHLFDARRLYYLRTGRMDDGELSAGKDWKFLDVLRWKARDEIESFLEPMESRLPAGELAVYAYAVFGVHRYFAGHVRHFPAALDPGRMDEYFLIELCRLNEDETFFAGAGRENGASGLHPYLVKYVWLYFDYSFTGGEEWHNVFAGRAKSRSRGRPAPEAPLSVEQAARVFGISAEEFQKMSRKDLIRRFRRRAKKLHPDKGGEHGEFVRLSEAYEFLLSKK